ncbi:MAG: hypothetical protein QXK07_07135 [Desulfurococcaceae archaeon]
MSENSGLAETLKGALEGIINAIVGIVKGIAEAVSTHAGTIGQILVIAGIVGVTIYALYRYVPFVRGLFGRILRF